MAKITIDKDRCKGCLLCISFCPKGLIRAGVKINKQGYRPAVYQENPECLGCLQCAMICPDCCITVYK